MKKLQDLTIKDAFMFAAVMSDAEQCKLLLALILEMDILEVDVVAEKESQLSSRISWCAAGCVGGRTRDAPTI